MERPVIVVGFKIHTYKYTFSIMYMSKSGWL